MSDAASYFGILEAVGIVGGLAFTALSFRQDAKVRGAQTQIEITAKHRELWTYFEANPELGALFDLDRKLKEKPLTERERRFVGFVFNHLRVTFYADQAGIYEQPQQLKKDVRTFFCYPAVRAAWESVAGFGDDEFVLFVKSCR